MRRAIRGLSNEAYHRGEEFKGHVSSSMIKTISKNGIHEWVNQAPFEANKSLDFGTACHAYFFEYDSFSDMVYVMNEERMNWTTKKGKEQKAVYHKVSEEMEQVILFPSQMRDIVTIWDNFSRTYPAYAKQFRDNQRDSELSIFVDDWRNHKAKVRVDHYGVSNYGSTLFDLKTTFDVVVPKNMKREVAKYQYDIQDVMYREVSGADAFIFIFVKTSHPFTVQCYRITNDYVLEGADLSIRYALEEYDKYVENPDDLLPTYNGIIQEI